nr:MAG TPA: hypothetical protein [Caudoviricetes sp.]
MTVRSCTFKTNMLYLHFNYKSKVKIFRYGHF